MSGMVSKSQIPTYRRTSLPSDLQLALIQFKNQLREGTQLTVFWNGKPDTEGRRHPGPSPLPRLADGCVYYEYDVGRGHFHRGNRRIVAEVVAKSGDVREVYFTDDHYTKGSFVRLT